jgi:hypothetical protein
MTVEIICDVLLKRVAFFLQEQHFDFDDGKATAPLHSETQYYYSEIMLYTLD